MSEDLRGEVSDGVSEDRCYGTYCRLTIVIYLTRRTHRMARAAGTKEPRPMRKDTSLLLEPGNVKRNICMDA